MGSIPGMGTKLDCGFDPWSGHKREAADRCFSLTLMFLSLSRSSFPLSKINKHGLRGGLKNNNNYLHYTFSIFKIKLVVMYSFIFNIGNLYFLFLCLPLWFRLSCQGLINFICLCKESAFALLCCEKVKQPCQRKSRLLANSTRRATN